MMNGNTLWAMGFSAGLAAATRQRSAGKVKTAHQTIAHRWPVHQQPNFPCRIQPKAPLPRKDSSLFTLTTKELILLKNRERTQKNRDKQSPRTKKIKRAQAAERMRRKRKAQRDAQAQKTLAIAAQYFDNEEQDCVAFSPSFSQAPLEKDGGPGSTSPGSTQPLENEETKSSSPPLPPTPPPPPQAPLEKDGGPGSTSPGSTRPLDKEETKSSSPPPPPTPPPPPQGQFTEDKIVLNHTRVEVEFAAFGKCLGTIIGKVGNEYAVQFEGTPTDLDGAHHQARRRRGAAPEIMHFRFAQIKEFLGPPDIVQNGGGAAATGRAEALLGSAVPVLPEDAALAGRGARQQAVFQELQARAAAAAAEDGEPRTPKLPEAAAPASVAKSGPPSQELAASPYDPRAHELARRVQRPARRFLGRQEAAARREAAARHGTRSCAAAATGCGSGFWLLVAASHMVDAKESNLCEQYGCLEIPEFNYEGEPYGLFCEEHKLQGMVNIVLQYLES